MRHTEAERRNTMPTMKRLALIPIAVAAIACQGERADSDLQSDLALVAASDSDLALLGSDLALAAVVSPIEAALTPAPTKSPTPTRRRAPQTPPPDVVSADQAEMEGTATTHEMVAVAPAENPVAADVPAPDAPPVVRPQPIEPRYPVGSGSVYGTGRDEGRGSGGVTVVIRGGRTGRDPCLPGEHGRSGPVRIISINQRIHTPSTFPQR
jgi:hypothetical protein